MSRTKDDERYAALRGSPAPTLANLIRWERIKLWYAAQDAMALLERRAPRTPDAIEYLWTEDTEFSESLTVMRKHRSRIAELQGMQAEAETEIAPDPALRAE